MRTIWKRILLLLLVPIVLLSCSSSEYVSHQLEFYSNDGVVLTLNKDSPLEIGKTISFTITNYTDYLILFPPDHNTRVYFYNENLKNWIEIENFFGTIITKDEFVGILPMDSQYWYASPIIENNSKSVNVKITVHGQIYKGSLTEFEESGVTDEIVTGTLEVVLQPAQPTPFGY